jgi:putative glutamine amidotransferase
VSPIIAPTHASPSRTAAGKPVVLLPACHKDIKGMSFRAVASKYIEAVRLAGGLPLLVPYATEDELDGLLRLADGVLLTGSPSNVHPRNFGQEVHDPAEPLDALRDGWVLPLIPKILAAGMPLLAICRGLQELNVALGGSLHQSVHELPGRRDHRMPRNAVEEVEYGPAHVIDIATGGLLGSVLGQKQIEVNSLHGQAIDRLAPALGVEATSPDGVIEAVSYPGAVGFVLGVQWHPEWRAQDNQHSMRIFDAFGEACDAYRHSKLDSVP